MNSQEILKKLFSIFEHYYTIKSDDTVTKPFDAEAEFRSHTEQYFLVKAAKLSEIDSNDYVYFKTMESLSEIELKKLAEIAWNAGLARVKPYSGHRNSDVTVVIIADKIDESAASVIKKIRYSKSYKFTFWGWSNFRLVAKELSSNRIYYNWHGRDLKKLLKSIN